MIHKEVFACGFTIPKFMAARFIFKWFDMFSITRDVNGSNFQEKL